MCVLFYDYFNLCALSNTVIVVTLKGIDVFKLFSTLQLQLDVSVSCNFLFAYIGAQRMYCSIV